MVGVLRWGLRLSFHSNVSLSATPCLQSASACPERTNTLLQISQTLLEKGAVERVRDLHSAGFYSRLFFVPKKNGGVRPIIDLSVLNLSLVIPRFKMETIHSIRKSLRLGHWTYSVDLQDAYFHIPIHPSSRRFLRFQVQDQVFQFKALPFGLSSAPLAFTMVVQQVKRFLHQHHRDLFQYLDDWLGQAPSKERATLEAEFLVNLCQHLGLLVNREKSELVPNQRFTFLGAEFDLILGLVRPSQANYSTLVSLIQSFLGSQAPSAHSWQQILGSLCAQEKFVQFGRLHMRSTQWQLADHWNQLSDSPDAPVPISPLVRSDLHWWLQSADRCRGVPLSPPDPTVRIFTDASTQGWGAHCQGDTYQGKWSAEESLLHINLLEMRAVRLTLERIRPAPNVYVLVATDNSTVVAYINKEGGTRSRPLWEETRSLFAIVLQGSFFLRARHIPGRLNVIADQLSRDGQILPTEWSLNQEIADMLFSRWGRPHIDLFATKFNHKCPLFVSPVPDPEAMDVDALSLKWDNLEVYAYPPPSILTQVLAKAKRSPNLRMILIAPHRETMAWFPTLCELKKEGPVKLPTTRTMLRQPRTNVFHQEPETLDLHAWLLVGPP